MRSASERDTLRFRDLGPVDVTEDSQVRAPGGPILGRLLARLLVDPGRRVDVSELVEAVWGDRGAARSQSTLDSHLHRLRRFLEPERSRSGAAGRLVLEAGGYRLVVTAEQVDSVRFAALVTQAGELLAAGEAGQALARAQAARELWRGRPLSPWSDEALGGRRGGPAGGAEPPADRGPGRRAAGRRPPRARAGGTGTRAGGRAAAGTAVGAVHAGGGPAGADRGCAGCLPAGRPAVPRRAGRGAWGRAAPGLQQLLLSGDAAPPARRQQVLSSPGAATSEFRHHRPGRGHHRPGRSRRPGPRGPRPRCTCPGGGPG